MAYDLSLLHNEYMVGRCVSSLSILILTLVSVGPASASLGEPANSVSADADGLHGFVQPLSRGSLRVQEIVSDNDMHVREFLTEQGIVFAVSWEGPVMPDLHQLLGARFAEYAQALSTQQRLGLHRAVRVATSDLVVESEGHLRAYVGRAYLPSLIPAGVSLGDLR
jgi:hypothetical protein